MSLPMDEYYEMGWNAWGEYVTLNAALVAAALVIGSDEEEAFIAGYNDAEESEII